MIPTTAITYNLCQLSILEPGVCEFVFRVSQKRAATFLFLETSYDRRLHWNVPDLVAKILNATLVHS